MYKSILAGAILAACSLEASAFSPSAPALRIGGRSGSIQGSSPLLVGKSMAKLQAANRRTCGSKIQMQAAGDCPKSISVPQPSDWSRVASRSNAPKVAPATTHPPRRMSRCVRCFDRRAFALLKSAGSLSFGKTQVVEAMEEQSATVIFMHGLGDTGTNWKKLSEVQSIPLLLLLLLNLPSIAHCKIWGSRVCSSHGLSPLDCEPLQAISIPYVKWVFPTAPMRDVTISDGMSMPGWFDIEGLKVSEMRADSEGIQQSIDHVKKVIEEEIASGTPSDRIVLAGFSQGGVIALGAAMQSELSLGGVMALSTWFPRGIADTPEKVDGPAHLTPTYLVLFH
jgi:predicted esterase